MVEQRIENPRVGGSIPSPATFSIREMVTLYVLRSRESGKRYVGITNNLSRRIAEHQSGSTKASQLLLDFDLVHTEQFPTHSEARQREIFLKSGAGRKWLDQFLSGPPEARKAAPLAGACAPQAHSIPSPATFFDQDLSAQIQRVAPCERYGSVANSEA